MNNSQSEKKDVLVDVQNLSVALDKFATDRNWEQFHSPKNLLLALTGEVGELAEIFQWMGDVEARSAGETAATAQAVKDELADVLFYLVRLASVLKVDLNAAAVQKLRSNAIKYPIETSLGNSTKYNKK
ncbi:MAG: nucleotide pyrophosphohydrolase [Candidatus Methylopumilus sp.]|jgi:NTP pyrophosphatase (non-canonical NTP hydrolase)|nr:nucleotide pyrophosphohydrolase [Candidatus Methylopumilus sp.]